MIEYKSKFGNRYRGGRPKVEFRTASKENYERFKKENPSIVISFKQYDEAIRTINEEYCLYPLETGFIVKLPNGIGGFSINKKKSPIYHTDEKGKHIALPIDWNETNKEGKLVYHFNEHTEGYHCKWYWFKSMARLKCIEIWELKICKKASALLTSFCFNTNNYLKYREYNLKKKTFK